MAHPSLTALLKFFAYGHLPPRLQDVSKPFSDLAHLMVDNTGALAPGYGLDGAEATAGLRKLLEAKDCFVRAATVTPGG